MTRRRTPDLLLIREQERHARPRHPPPDHSWPASQFHDPTRTPQVRVRRRPAPMLHLGAHPSHPKPLLDLAARDTTHAVQPRHDTISAKRLKVTTALDAAELLAITCTEDKPRITLHICLPERTMTAEIAAKSLRKAQTAIRDVGAESIVLVLQGHLVGGDTIAEAGLSALPRAAKPP